MPNGSTRQDYTTRALPDSPQDSSLAGNLTAARSQPERIALGLAIFAVAFSVCQAVVMMLMRSGFPTPSLALALGPALVSCTALGPVLWALRRPGRALWIGPLALAVSILGYVLVSLGTVGIALVCAAALASLIGALGAFKRMPPRSGDLGGWALLFVVMLALSFILIEGNKYLNYLADQLALAGRTDGDILMHGAMANAILYYHFPSSGIDGLRLNRYHFGIDILAALTARGTGSDIIFSLVGIRSLVLFPMAVFGAAWGGLIIARSLFPARVIGGRALMLGAGAVLFFLQNSAYGANLTMHSDPMLLSGVIMCLMAPAAIALISAAPHARAGWAIALVGIPLLSAAKVSVGFVWAGVVCFWALRRLGLKQPGFWAVSAIAAALFIPGYFLFADPTGAGAVLFGTPFFAESFRDGDYFDPLLLHFQGLVTIVWLLCLRVIEPTLRRFLVEGLAVAILIGVTPGLLMDIPGHDAYYFMIVVAWMSVPVAVALLGSLPFWLNQASPARRRIGWTAIAAVSLLIVALAATVIPLKFNIAMANNALLRTGDRSYYDQDNRKGWREDGRRAVKELGVLGMFKLTPPPPAGASLVAMLRAYKVETGNAGAAYLEPDSDYWPLVSDCDGKATYPMSMAGVPVIDGYLPVQDSCPQQFSLRGYGTPPAVRTTLSDADLCTRTKQEGFTTVLRIKSLGDRTTDRRLECR